MGLIQSLFVDFYFLVVLILLVLLILTLREFIPHVIMKLKYVTTSDEIQILSPQIIQSTSTVHRGRYSRSYIVVHIVFEGTL